LQLVSDTAATMPMGWQAGEPAPEEEALKQKGPPVQVERLAGGFTACVVRT
jgi:hypothetical protein